MAEPDFLKHSHWSRTNGVWSPTLTAGLGSPPPLTILRGATRPSDGLPAVFSPLPQPAVDSDERAPQGIASWFLFRPWSSNQGPATYLHQVPTEIRDRYTQEVIAHMKHAMTLAMHVVEGKNAGIGKQAKIRQAERIIFTKIARVLHVTVDSLLQDSDFESIFDFNGPLFRFLGRKLTDGLQEHLEKIGSNNVEASDIRSMTRGQVDPCHVYPIVRRCFPCMLASHSNTLRNMVNNIARMMNKPQKRSKSTKTGT